MVIIAAGTVLEPQIWDALSRARFTTALGSCADRMVIKERREVSKCTLKLRASRKESTRPQLERLSEVGGGATLAACVKSRKDTQHDFKVIY
jgi:hypothetical protein